jgi:hypothetical protein
MSHRGLGPMYGVYLLSGCPPTHGQNALLLLPVDAARCLDAFASSSLQATGSSLLAAGSSLLATGSLLAHATVLRCFSSYYELRVSRLFHPILLQLLKQFCIEVNDMRLTLFSYVYSSCYDHVVCILQVIDL